MAQPCVGIARSARQTGCQTECQTGLGGKGELMTYLMEVPVDRADDSGIVLVEVDPAEVPGDLELASDEAGKAAARARRSLEESLDHLRPSLQRIITMLEGLAPQETEVEFGLKIGGETGVIIAKGTPNEALP
jgi:hypothetical protein